jgi:hypothetical protein
MNDPALLAQLPALQRDGGNDKMRVQRGASWRDSDDGRLLASVRMNAWPSDSDLSYGFRCVLESGLPITAPPKKVFVVSSSVIAKYYVAAGAVVKKDEQFVAPVMKGAQLVGPLDSAWGVAISGGKIYVANYGNGTIGEFDAKTGAVINPALVTGLEDPTGIAVSGDKLFVVYRNVPADQTGSGNVGEYTTSGETVNATLVKGLVSPWAIAVSGGNIFVAQDGLRANAGLVGEYTTAGATVNASLITGLSGPECIAVSGENIFVSQSGPDGKFTTKDGIYEYSTSGATIKSPLIKVDSFPKALAVSGDDLYVSLDGLGVQIYTTSGASVNQNFVEGSYPFFGIAVDDSP